jgi:hypothetical protein
VQTHAGAHVREHGADGVGAAIEAASEAVQFGRREDAAAKLIPLGRSGAGELTETPARLAAWAWDRPTILTPLQRSKAASARCLDGMRRSSRALTVISWEFT